MAVQPRVRPVGQQVVVAHDVKAGTTLIRKGYLTTVVGFTVGDDMKVSYKIEYNHHYYWVKPADIRTRR